MPRKPLAGIPRLPRLAGRERFPSGEIVPHSFALMGRTVWSPDPPEGCHIELELLHEPYERARISK